MNPDLKVVPTDAWWKHQFDVNNNKVIPLYSWNRLNKDAKATRKPFDVKKTEQELKDLKVKEKISLKQSQLDGNVLQKYWDFVKEGIKLK